LLGGLDLEVYLGIFRQSLTATTKKKVVNFLAKKVHPLRQNPGYAYDHKVIVRPHASSY